MTTAAGTNLVADLGGPERAPLLDTGRLQRGTGALTNMPAGEVAICPIEGTTDGRLVADMTVSTSPRPLARPIDVSITDGRVSGITGGDEAEVLPAGGAAGGFMGQAPIRWRRLRWAQIRLHVISALLSKTKRRGIRASGFWARHRSGWIEQQRNTRGLHLFGSGNLEIDGVSLVTNGVVTPEGLARDVWTRFPVSCITK